MLCSFLNKNDKCVYFYQFKFSIRNIVVFFLLVVEGSRTRLVFSFISWLICLELVLRDY